MGAFLCYSIVFFSFPFHFLVSLSLHSLISICLCLSFRYFSLGLSCTHFIYFSCVRFYPLSYISLSNIFILFFLGKCGKPTLQKNTKFLESLLFYPKTLDEGRSVSKKQTHQLIAWRHNTQDNDISIMTFSLTTLILKSFYVTLRVTVSIDDTQHK